MNHEYNNILPSTQYNAPMTSNPQTRPLNNSNDNAEQNTDTNNNNNTESEPSNPRIEEQEAPPPGEQSPSITRTPSQSSNPSSNVTIDSSEKITAREDTWSADTTNDLLNYEQYKEKYAQAKHWKACKLDLKKHVARVKNEAAARKFEMDIKVIGRR
jgi:hypothetical protein